jgi:hypothetical protein
MYTSTFKSLSKNVDLTSSCLMSHLFFDVIATITHIVAHLAVDAKFS